MNYEAVLEYVVLLLGVGFTSCVVIVAVLTQRLHRCRAIIEKQFDTIKKHEATLRQAFVTINKAKARLTPHPPPTNPLPTKESIGAAGGK